LTYPAQAGRVYISVFVLGELVAGLRAGSKEKQNRQILDRFLAKSNVVFSTRRGKRPITSD